MELNPHPPAVEVPFFFFLIFIWLCRVFAAPRICVLIIMKNPFADLSAHQLQDPLILELGFSLSKLMKPAPQNCRKDQTNGKCLNVKCLAETWARSDSVTKTAVLSFPRASNPLPNPKGQALKAEVQPHSTAHLATQEAHTGRETLPALHPLQAPLLSLSVQAPRLAHSPLQLLDLSSPLLPSHQP